MRYTLTQSNDYEPGTWKSGRSGEYRTATIACPECGNPLSLSQHTINPKGYVSPSVVCPWTGCEFHEWVVLEGWATI